MTRAMCDGSDTATLFRRRCVSPVRGRKRVLVLQGLGCLALAATTLLALGGCTRATPSPRVTATMARAAATATLQATATAPVTSSATPEPAPSPMLPVLTATPLPLLLVTITPENAGRLTQLARWGSDAELGAIAYSPDGRLLAVGTYAGIDLLDAHTGATVHIIEAPAWTVAFSPDGRMLASGWQDGILQLWQVAECGGTEAAALSLGQGCGSLLQTLVGHSREVWSVAFSPDGDLLASAANDQTVRLWQVGDCTGQAGGSALSPGEGCGQPLHTLEGHGASVEAVAFSRDGTILASGGWDWTVRLWQISSGELLQVLEEHQDAVVSLAFRPAPPGSDTVGTVLAAGTSTGNLELWQVDGDVNRLATVEAHYGRVNGIAFSPDGSILASGGDYLDQEVRLWQVEDTVSPLHVLRGHNGAVKSLAFRPDGQILASAGGTPDTGVRLWGVEGE